MALPDTIVIIQYLVIRRIAKQNKNVNLELFPPNNQSSFPSVFQNKYLFTQKFRFKYSSNKHK